MVQLISKFFCFKSIKSKSWNFMLLVEVLGVCWVFLLLIFATHMKI